MTIQSVKRDNAQTRRSRRLALYAGLSMLVLTGLPTMAAAQSVFDRDITSDVLSRSHPEYAPLGVPLDSFTLYPTLGIGATYDDNIYGLPNKTDAVVGDVKPAVRLASNWDRNEVDLTLNSEYDFYSKYTNENALQYGAALNGRYDIDHASAITLTASDALLTEPRTSPDSIAAFLHPVQYTDAQVGLTGYREFDRIRITASFHYSNFEYDNVDLPNGNVFDEKSRDETALSEVFRADYAISPNFAIFASASPNQNMFDEQPPKVPLDYNSNGVGLLTGVNFQITHLMTGEVGIGYYKQDYVDKAFGTVSGLDYNAILKYYPTQLLTLTLTAQHSIAASGIPDSPSTNVDNGNVNADYELMRNVIVSVGGGLSVYNYPGLERTDYIYNGNARVTYHMNRIVSLALRYGYINQNSTGSGHGYNFDDNQIGLSITLQR